MTEQERFDLFAVWGCCFWCGGPRKPGVVLQTGSVRVLASATTL